MDNVKPVITVSQPVKVNDLVKLTNTQDLYKETNCIINPKEYEIRLLHHNVQSMHNKLLDIAIMLTTEHSNINILCFTEHWLSEVELQFLNTDGFRLVSNFSRTHSLSGGSCIFTRNSIATKEVNYFRKLRNKKAFEISAVELPDNGIILACIYRSTDSDFHTFFHILELLIFKVSSKGKHLVLCGDLNVNFMQHSSKLVDLQNLLLMNSLINIVKSPKRITNQSVSLIDVIIVNSMGNKMFTMNQDLGYSDHLAQLLDIKSKNSRKSPVTTHERHFTDMNIEEFQYLLHTENWDEVIKSVELTFLLIFLGTLLAFILIQPFP